MQVNRILTCLSLESHLLSFKKRNDILEERQSKSLHSKCNTVQLNKLIMKEFKYILLFNETLTNW